MKDLSGIYYGVILGFIFIIACNSPLNSEETEVSNSNAKYQISTNVVQIVPNSQNLTYYEVIIDTETGDVVSRKYRNSSESSIGGTFTLLLN